VPSLLTVRAVQTTRLGDPEVLEIVDVPQPRPFRDSSSTTSRRPAWTLLTPTTDRRPTGLDIRHGPT